MLADSKLIAHNPQTLAMREAAALNGNVPIKVSMAEIDLHGAHFKGLSLHELYYVILKGEAGNAFKQAFGVGNEIARSIAYLSARISEPVSIEEMADYIGMSRAVFHRKFKQATNMSPIQFVKSMRLNHAAMKISEGVNVNVAAMEVGYVSSSQFSREFKRMYGSSPKQWIQHKKQLERPMP